ncbi:MAG: hypothetical protein J5654_09515 [Victivallales bacterium]|nr:hypothetical protein [Victivallales bacterium]
MTQTKTQPQQQTQMLRPAATDEFIAALDNAAKYGEDAALMAKGFAKMFRVGAAVQQLTALLTPQIMEPIMALQNSPLGFLTDSKTGGYPVDTVRAAVIQAAIEGLSVTGNEFNILAGRMYITKNGMKRKLSQIPGLRKHVTPGIPKTHPNGGGAIVPVHVDWTYNGEHNTQDMEFAVKMNSGMGADALIGKATRKALAWLYEEITGNAVSDGDVADMEPINITPKQSPLEKAPEAGDPNKVAHAEAARPPKDDGDLYDIDEDDGLEAM